MSFNVRLSSPTPNTVVPLSDAGLYKLAEEGGKYSRLPDGTMPYQRTDSWSIVNNADFDNFPDLTRELDNRAHITRRYEIYKRSLERQK